MKTNLTDGMRQNLRKASRVFRARWLLAILKRGFDHLLTDERLEVIMGNWRASKGPISPSECALLWTPELYLLLSRWLYKRGRTKLAVHAMFHAMEEDPACFHGGSEMAFWSNFLHEKCPR